MYRRLSTPNFWRLEYLGIYDKVQLIPCDILDGTAIIEAVITSEPDLIFNLAAQSFVGASFEQPVGTAEITGLSTTKFLEAVRQCQPKARYYQASTSELFGWNGVQGNMQNELTPFEPASPYAVAKLYAYWITRVYRESYNIFACNGILFNSESPLRGQEFVTRKITNGFAKIKLGLETKVELGNLEAARDWSYAPDVIQAMWLMLQQDKPDDYVIASGEAHTVREFLEETCKVLDLGDYRKCISQSIKHMRPMDVNWLCGDASKAKTILGWEPKVRFKELVEIMAKEDLNRWQRWQKGEHFPWDAPNYPSEANILSRMQRYGG